MVIYMNTTISIQKSTRSLLQEFGKKSESYDDIILKMYNQIKLVEAITEFVNDDEYSSLDEAEDWIKLKMKILKK